MTSLNDLRNLKPKKNFFVALDSDGTIFDSMNHKHKNCFVKPLIDIFNLENIKDDVENYWIKINLFSDKRGINRFEALILTFEQLEKKTNFSLEFDKVWIHGYLHLIGYDHKKLNEFKKMLKKEKLILRYFHKAN